MTAFIHRYHRILFAGCAVFFLARWAFQQTRIERLMDLPADDLITIRDGSVYFRVRYPQDVRRAEPDPAGKREPAVMRWEFVSTPFTVRTTPVTGGRRRLLGEDKRRAMYYVAPRITENGIAYLAYNGEQTRMLRARLSAPGIQRRSDGRLTYVQAQLYTVPFSGGPPVAAAPDLTLRTVLHPAFMLPPYVVIGDTLLWLEADLDANLVPRNARRNAQGSITDAPLRLLKVPLRGGTPQVIVAGLPKETGLHATTEAVWWMVPGKTEGSGPDIYRLSIHEERPQCVLKNAVNREFPLEAGGRIYWRRDKSSDPEWRSGAALLASLDSEIVSAAPDGSDGHVVYADAESPFPLTLYAHAGKLYFSQVEKTARNRADSSLRTVLYRLEPGSPSRKKRVMALPRDGILSRFDGDYVYFTLVEQRENVFDWSREGLLPTFVPVLYRCRLPD
jgi:hypothetical protein